MIEATDKAEHLAHEFEHHCKDETTFATNTIYANATGELRQAEGKVKELNDCRDKLDTLLAAQREVAELKSKSPQDLKKIEETETLIANGQEVRPEGRGAGRARRRFRHRVGQAAE